MKISIPFFLLILVALFSACNKEEAQPVSAGTIADITLTEMFIAGQTHEIVVTINKPTPCYEISEILESGSGKNRNYDFIIVNQSEMCVQMIEEEQVSVDFEPTEVGEYVLNFYINGNFFETRTVNVTD